MTPRFPFLAQRMFNAPLAIHEPKAEIVMAALADRLGVSRLFRADGTVVALVPEELTADQRGDYRPYDVLDGIAIIPVEGTLVQKTGTLRPYSGMTGYDGLRACLGLALEDDAVRAVAFDVDSPGGEVAGCFDLVDAIRDARGQKPLWAILDESAYSAAYAIAAACDRITVPRTGGTGSIGVIGMHVDLSRALDAGGITVTMVRHGERKARGNPYEALDKATLAAMQADVDAMGELFCDTVARCRGLKASVVRAMQARTFLGAAGVEAGLADQVMAPDRAFARLRDTLH